MFLKYFSFPLDQLFVLAGYAKQNKNYIWIVGEKL